MIPDRGRKRRGSEILSHPLQRYYLFMIPDRGRKLNLLFRLHKRYNYYLFMIPDRGRKQAFKNSFCLLILFSLFIYDPR